MTRETAYVESFVTDGATEMSDRCALDFYEIDELGGQIDNWFGPTTNCLLALCRAAGFARVELLYREGGRAGVVCSRKWEDGEGTAPAPRLVAAVNNRTNQPVFHLNKDEYVCAYFWHEGPVTRQSLRVEILGLGVPTLIVAARGEGEWQANFRLPPGLPVGTHQVRLRTLESAFSNWVEFRLVSQESLPMLTFEAAEVTGDDAPVLCHLANSADGGKTFHGYPMEHLSGYFRTPVLGLTGRQVLVVCGDLEVEIETLIDLGNGEWQVNAKLPGELAVGRHPVRVRLSTSEFSAEGWIARV